MKFVQVTRSVLLWAAAFVAAPETHAQSPPIASDNLLQKSQFDFGSLAAGKVLIPSGSARLRMFGMPTGFLMNPVGVDMDDPNPVPDGADYLDSGTDDAAGFVLALGNFNPFFDLRRPDDPRGLGYSKLHAQYQVIDLGPTNVSLTLQALAPSGRDVGGMANGPTIFSPACAWFHDLGAGVAVQGYVGQSIHANSRWNESFGTRFHFGMGIQAPVPECTCRGEDGLFFFVQALGRYRYDNLPDEHPAVWDIYPGLQWRANENCWFAVGASRRFLFTWCWQY